MLLRKAKYILPVALALLCGGAALALFLRPRELPLLPRATRVAAVAGAHPYYWWLSDNVVLRFRDPASGDWTFVRLDVNSQKEKPVARLTSLFARSGGKPESIQVAPDGDWMLWTGAKGQTVVSTTDGWKHLEHPPGKPSEKRWMSVGLRWIELVCDGKDFTGAVVHNVLRPKEIQRRPLVPTISCSPQLVDVARMTPTTDEHILATLWNGPEGGIKPAVILALVLHAQINAVGKFKLHPPRDAERGEIVFAPIYGRLAWVLKYRPEWSRLTGESPRVGLWVTSMRDWRSHEVGSVEVGGDGKDGSGPLAVQWSPDGNSLSFVYKDALWTIPAD